MPANPPGRWPALRKYRMATLSSPSGIRALLRTGKAAFVR
jgi:hypothetical protein